MSDNIREILREILLEDKSILLRRDELVDRLEKNIPENLIRDFTSMKRAINDCNVGESFFSADSGDERKRKSAKERSYEALLGSGMLAARARFVVDTFASALDWDKKTTGLGEEPPVPAVPEPKQEKATSPNAWMCACGQSNDGKYCSFCGKKKPGSMTSGEPTAAVQHAVPHHVEQGLSSAAVPASIPPVPAPVTTLQKGLAVTPSSNPSPNSAISFDREKWTQRRKEFQAEYFTIIGRLNRMAYLVKSIKLALWILLFSVIAAVIGKIASPLGALLAVGIFLISAAGNWMLMIRRLHDLDKSGWLALLALIPYLNILLGIYLLFFKGTEGSNRYGSDPLQFT